MIIDFGLVYIEPCNTIYIVGGMDPLTFETKNTVYTFNVLTRTWSSLNSIPSLNVARKSCACFYDGSFLYAAGGSTAELDQVSLPKSGPGNVRPVGHIWLTEHLNEVRQHYT